MVLQRSPLGAFDPYDDALRELVASVHGQVQEPTHPDYDETRKVWSGNHDRRPAIIVRSVDAADVVQAVTFARAFDLPVSVRSGGHSMSGLGVADGGVMIDLSAMKAMEIDPEKRIARAGPGVTWSEYAEQAQEYGLATSSGDMGSVGVGGLTLGGGIGWMVRKHGLTIDHLIAVEVVTADGRLLRASAEENQDLFWGLRGGGGNFGIATAFEFRLHPAGLILGGAIFYPGHEATEVLRGFADYMRTAPEELTAMAIMMSMPPVPFVPEQFHFAPVVAIMVCNAGSPEDGEVAVAPLRRLGTPVGDIISPMPYPALFEVTKEGQIKGNIVTHRSTYLYEISDALIETVIEHRAATVSPAAMVQIRALGGAMARIPTEETAFAHRDKPFMLTFWDMTRVEAEAEAQLEWSNAFWHAVRPYGNGVYVNFLEDEGEARIREAYNPTTYRRLVDLKNRYDPTNVFRLNQNIRPTV